IGYRAVSVGRAVAVVRHPLRRGASERIADAEVEGRVAPFEGFQPPVARGQAGVVYPHAPVEPDDNQVEVVPQAQSGVEAEFLVERIEAENLVAGGTGDACEPDVPHVEEYRSVQGVPQRETEFEVCLQPEIAELAFESRFAPFGRVARTERPDGPAAHAVAAADVEHAVHGERGGIAVGQADAAVETVGDCRTVSYRDGIADAGIHTEILRVADA